MADNSDRKKIIIRKCILLALLAAVLVFLFIQRDHLRESARAHLLDKTRQYTTETVSVTGSHVIEQPVVTESDVVGSVGLYFKKKSENTASGLIELALVDPEGNTVADTSLDASFIQSDGVTKFMPGGSSEAFNASRISNSYGAGTKTNIKVVKGETYTIRISFKDVACDGPLELTLCSYDEGKSGDPAEAVMDGKSLGGSFVELYLVNRKYDKGILMRYAFIILLTLIFVLIPFELIDERLAAGSKEKDGRKGFVLSTWLSRLLFIAAPLAAYFIIQKYQDFTNAEFTGQLFSERGTGALNLVIIGFVWWLLYTISNRVRFASAATVLLGSAFGFTNYMLVQFRDSPLVATDIAQLDTALTVADSYTLSLSEASLMAITLTALWCIAVYAVPGHKGPSPKKRLIALAVLLIWGGALYHTFFSSSFIEDHGFRVSSFKPRGTYNENGSAFSFIISLRNSIVRKPDGYDVKNVEAIAEKYPSDEAVQAEKVSAKTPNIIIIMNESFSDLSVLGQFETNEDYMPFYRSLKETTVNGWMDSSVFGGSTANSEFESLTSFTMQFLPFHSVPFRSVVKTETPSLTQSLKSMGYGGNIAFIAVTKDAYNRGAVYPLLGFEKHISIEQLKNPEKIRDFVSDSYDYSYLEQQYEAFRKEDPDTPFFIFNPTIQNHGGYSLNTGLVDAGISITSPENQDESAQQYLNLIKYSDDALKELIEYFSSTDEETVIMLFGDHQPRVGDAFYASLRAQQPELSDLEWSELMHRVPFMIWANYDLGSAAEAAKAGGAGGADSSFITSANYLGPYLKQITGLPMTGFEKYLLDLRQKLPVLSDICCIDADGNIYDSDNAPEFESELNEYAQLQYNGLVDAGSRVEGFFRLKK